MQPSMMKKGGEYFVNFVQFKYKLTGNETLSVFDMVMILNLSNSYSQIRKNAKSEPHQQQNAFHYHLIYIQIYVHLKK